MNHPDVDAATGRDLHQQVALQLHRGEQRYTDRRRRLVTTLLQAARPLTLPEIVDLSPDLAQSSAYRNLDVLEQSGVIRRIPGTGDHAHFELAEQLLGHHHHLICVDCGTIVDVELDDELEALVDERLADAAAKAGFTPVTHSLDLHGYCAACAAG